MANCWHSPTRDLAHYREPFPNCRHRCASSAAFQNPNIYVYLFSHQASRCPAQPPRAQTTVRQQDARHCAPLSQLFCRYIARAAQGQGLGRQLLALALDWMRANGDGPLWIGCASNHVKRFDMWACSYGCPQSVERQRARHQHVQTVTSHRYDMVSPLRLRCVSHICCMYTAQGFERVGGYQFAVGEFRDDEFILRKG
jgi:GNAT superfamily N-acetyltransferase